MQRVLLKARGLHSYNNKLGSLPEGALVEASNVVINRNDIIEPRRGFAIYGDDMGLSVTADVAKQLIVYKGRILRHFSTTLDYDNGSGTFTSFSGSYSETSAGLRIKSIEANSNLYFTTSTGVKKLSAASASTISSSTITNAGGVKALDIKATLNSETGFLNQDSVCSYRAVWGIRDANNNVILGTPSGRIVVRNSLLSLLIADFNNFLQTLDIVSGLSSSDLLSNTNYTSSYKLSPSASASNLKANLVALGASLDSDMVVTSSVTVADATIATNIASVVFSSTVASFLSVGDVVTFSGFTNSHSILNGTFTLKSVSTTTVTFDHSTVTLASPLPGNPGYVTSAACVRLKYSVGDYRTNDETTIDSNIAGIAVVASKMYIRFSGAVNSYVKVKDTITLSGLEEEESDLNGVYIVKSIFTQTATNDTIQLDVLRSNIAEQTDVDVTNGSVVVNAASEQLTLSDIETTAQLEALQTYYDDIVSALQLEPTGIINASYVTYFDDSNSTQSATTNVVVTIPSGVTTSHFLQLYRTNLTSSSGVSNLLDFDPGDEHKLAYEANPTADEITAGSMTIQDIVPEDFLGANLYTNPNTGEGIAQANEVPPLAKDIALFKGYTFYANTVTKYRLNLSLNSIVDFSDNITQTISSIAANGTDVTITFASSISGYSAAAGDAVVLYDFAGGAINCNGVYRITSVTSTTIVFKRALGNFTESTAANMGGVDLIKSTKTLSVMDSTPTTNTYTFNASTPQFTAITCLSGAAISGDYFLIYSPTTNYYVWYNTGASSDPAVSGATGIEVVVSAGDTATQIATATSTKINQYNDFLSTTNAGSICYIENTVTGYCTAPAAGTSGFTFSTTAALGEDATNHKVIISTLETPAQQVEETANSLIRVINKYSSGLVYAFYLSGETDVPGQIFLESRSLGGNAFYLNVSVSTISDQFTPNIPTSGSTLISTNETSLNRLYYSKYQQPEAVPLLNYIDVGPKDDDIYRIIALRDSLFIFKKNAIYRLSGEVTPFTVGLLDSSANLIASDSAAVLNNQVYILSNQGLVRVSETGVEIISNNIKDAFVKLNDSLYPYFSRATFGLGYESDSSYYLFTVKEPGDNKAFICYRYNAATNSFTTLDISKTCGVVNPADNKLYLGAGDTNYIEKERKNYDRTDYSDRELTLDIAEGAISETTIIVDDVSDYEAGDIFLQTQYLTIAQFNRLLRKLDNDLSVADSNYYSLLSAIASDNLRTKLTSLATKLDADTGVTDTNYVSTISGYSSSFSDVQAAYNVITAKLNSDASVSYNNYPTSTGTTVYEVEIVGINLGGNVITTAYAYPFTIGPASVFKKINSSVIWAPLVLDDPSQSKHVSEATIMFEDTSFTSAMAAFSSDLNPEFTEVDINIGNGNGSFGNSTYGEGSFGGAGTSIPFRTYIPRNTQRCRFLNVKFEHSVAREKYAIYGISETYNIISQRAYK